MDGMTAASTEIDCRRGGEEVIVDGGAASGFESCTQYLAAAAAAREGGEVHLESTPGTIVGRPRGSGHDRRPDAQDKQAERRLHGCGSLSPIMQRSTGTFLF